MGGTGGATAVAHRKHPCTVICVDVVSYVLLMYVSVVGRGCPGAVGTVVNAGWVLGGPGGGASGMVVAVMVAVGLARPVVVEGSAVGVSVRVAVVVAVGLARVVVKRPRVGSTVQVARSDPLKTARASGSFCKYCTRAGGSEYGLSKTEGSAA